MPATIADINGAEIDSQVAEFDARHSPDGLLLRYARGRVNGFPARQALVLLGVLTLALFVSPGTGALAGAFALAGEGADCGYLAWLARRMAQGRLPPLARFGSTLTAAAHAASIAACVMLAWVSVPGQIASAPALALLAAAAINAGIVLPFHRPAALIRFAVFGATALALVAGDFLAGAQNGLQSGFDAMALVVLAYVCAMFVAYIVRGHAQHVARARELLERGRALARANAELVEQQREVRSLAQVARNANDSVIITGADGRIRWVNEAFTRITGYSAEEALGRTPAGLLDAPETSRQESAGIARAASEGRAHRTQILNRAKDGRLVWMGVNQVPVFDEAGALELVVSIERDITEAKAREEELARARAEAERAAAAKAQFLATMSHEIRTPMNGIIGMADLLCEADLGRDERHYVETIRRSGEALLTIINDILDYSKLKAGRPVTHAVDFRLMGPLDEALDLLRPAARKKGIFIDVTAEEGLPERVAGDDGRLRQILLNVIGNAVKFTGQGGVTVTVSSRGAGGGGQEIAFAVRDSGPGIAAGRLDEIFEEFAQGDAAIARHHGGSGLGLAISRLLAREMGGDVTASSTPGEGALFTITLRLGPAGAVDMPPAPAPMADAAAALDGKTLLLAEDNRTNRLLVRKYLRGLPVQLLFATNGREAVEMAQRHAPDIVLMDMAMPVMDGLSAARAIRADKTSHPRIIALTANAFAADKAACLAAGMDGFLTKPLRKSELLRQLSARGAEGPG